MRVLIIGAAGMIGQKLAHSVAQDSNFGSHHVSDLHLVDRVKPAMPVAGVSNDFIRCGEVDITNTASIESVLADNPDVIVQLAAVVSGEAEADFSKGYLVNLAGMQNLLEHIRSKGRSYRPRVLFSSSIAVFGGRLPDLVSDDHLTAPQSSYGTQKAICELLLQDYTRKEYVDGLSVRLPTIIVRPGLPNKAASSFYSGIIREPLNGEAAVLPVDRSMRHWFASPRAAIGYFHHAASLSDAVVRENNALNLPGISATVQDLLDALQRVAGDEALALVEEKPDERIKQIVTAWPKAFDTAAADALGFKPDESLDAIVKTYIDDELTV